VRAPTASRVSLTVYRAIGPHIEAAWEFVPTSALVTCVTSVKF
jgi:hypothetical protein